ncbi:hypothetical protein MHA_2604 [Mannheimia haemolytica PHL213]|nr:hypothetical protein MHA_2604 [Mannheimia haemolytica PHL213]
MPRIFPIFWIFFPYFSVFALCRGKVNILALGKK